MKKFRIFILFLLAVVCLFPVGILAGPKTSKVLVSWDANSEADLGGYKIYYGKKSRKDSDINNAENQRAVAEKACGLYKEREQTAIFEFCVDSWIKWCKDTADLLCDSDYFQYEMEIDVKNVTTYTIENLPDGTYFFSAVAYDKRGYEGKFTDELSLSIDDTAPGIVVNLNIQTEREYRLTIEEIAK